MNREPIGFKRLVLSLQSSAPEAATRLAVEFAELFDIELLALFIEDAGLQHFAEMPFAREIRSLGGRWRSIEPEQLRQDLDLAAARAERRFGDAARRYERRKFQVVRGGAAQALAAVSRAGDVVVVRAPTAAERVAEPFASLISAVFESHAAVLVAPPTQPRAKGAVAALAASDDDPSIGVASAIANAAREKLVLVELGARAPGSLLAALQRVAPRLAVASRSALSVELALAIAAAGRIPILSLEKNGSGDSN